MTNQPTQTAMAVSKSFRFKAEQTIDESQIILDNIQHKSSGFIATRLLRALEKQEIIYQDLFIDEGGVPAKDYHFVHEGFDMREVAMIGVQLAGLIVYLDVPMVLEDVANATYTYKSFRTIARSNASIIPNVFDKGTDNKAHWVMKVKKAIHLAIAAGLIDYDATDETIKRSKAYISTCISRAGVAHQTQKITLENRRKERVKTRFNPHKDGTSGRVRSAMEFIEDQAQVINVELLEVINEYMEEIAKTNKDLPEILRDSSHVIKGCNALVGKGDLHSEYFADLRGRLYQFAHAGPNPQSSDLARALCYHNVENVTNKYIMVADADNLVPTDTYEIFISELENEVCEGKAELYSEKMLRSVAARPLECLTHFLSTGLPIKKFFTYMALAKDWVSFEDNNQADCRIGFGPDAKCSGAQLLAILAGCEDLGAACGLTTAEERPKDPYVRSTDEIEKLTPNSPYLPLTRPEIKTPFMAIQYGGGVPALRYKKFEPSLDRIGVPAGQRDKFCKDVVIRGILNSLGPKVTALIDGLQQAASAVISESGKPYFEYRHIDGFKCTKKGEAKVALTAEPFRINYGDVDTDAVIFGSFEESKGGKRGWSIDSNTTGPLQRQNFTHYFPVHFIQGLDAVIAREIANQAKAMGLEGYTSIHDQFRVCLRDAPKMKEVVALAYEEVFINNNPLFALQSQLKGVMIKTLNPLEGIKQIVTPEVLRSQNAFYFE